jgi:hypothetical protein
MDKLECATLYGLEWLNFLEYYFTQLIIENYWFENKKHKMVKTR